MDDRELCYLPAVEALALFRSKQLSPLTLLRALIARAEEVEPQINAFTERYFEEALEKAAEAEQCYARGEARALEGLPVAIKDEPEPGQEDGGHAALTEPLADPVAAS